MIQQCVSPVETLLRLIAGPEILYESDLNIHANSSAKQWTPALGRRGQRRRLIVKFGSPDAKTQVFGGPFCWPQIDWLEDSDRTTVVVEMRPYSFHVFAVL